MARRSRRSVWGGALQKSLQRSFGSLARATLRAGTRAAATATAKALKAAAKASAKASPEAPAKKAPARRRAAPRGAAPARAAEAPVGRWLAGTALGPTGARRYRLYVPPGARRATPRPVLVLLHGCDQDAAGIARSTRLQALAAREGFLLLCPEQERLANAHGCWNWFDTRSGRAQAEAASIAAAIAQVCARHGGDATRVVVAGLSAGAAMAALLALRHPALVQAVVMHSGVGPGAAQSTAGALAAMRGRRAPGPIAAPVGTALPALLVIQGMADRVVAPRNGRAVAERWAAAAGAREAPARTVQRGARHAATLTDFKVGTRSVVTLCEVAGLGHAWSGGAARLPYGDPKGPDAARMVWAFAQRQFGLGPLGPLGKGPG